MKSVNDKEKKIINSLPYLEYLGESGIYVLKDKSLGVIYKLDLLDHSPMTFEDIKDCRESLESLLDLPHNCIIQFFSQNSLLTKESIEDESQLPWEIESETARFFREKKVEELKKQAEEGSLLKQELYLSIRFIPENAGFSFSELIPKNFSMVNDFLDEVSQHEKKVEEFEKILSRYKVVSKFNFKTILPEDLRNIVRKAVRVEEGKVSQIVESHPLNEQILFSNIECDHKGLAGKQLSRTVSLTVPSEYCDGDGVSFLDLKFPSIVSMRITRPSRLSVSKSLGIKEWCTKNSFSHRSKRQFDEIQETKKKLAKDDPCLNLSWSVTVFGKNKEEVEKRVNSVVGMVVEKLKCNAIIEEDCGFDIFWNSLPLNYDPKSEWGMQRFIPIHRSELASFLPVFGPTKGLNKKLQLFESREGGAFPFSLLEAKTAQHTVFLGDSGGGKSFLMNNCLNGVKALDLEPIAIVFDYNTSQTMNSKLYKGEINRFSLNDPPKMSVFRGLYDEKKVSVLVNWMCEAIRLTSKSFEIETEHKEALSQSVKLAYSKKIKSEGTTFVEGELVDTPLGEKVILDMDDIGTELSYLPRKKGFEKYKSIVESLLLKLRSFYGDGVYADYFKPQKEDVEFDKRFYVFDFEGIKDDPVLLNLTLAASFEQVRQIKLKPENAERQVFAIVDEIAVLGRDCPLMTQYLVNKAETSRKDAFWIWGATNRPENFFDIEACRALFQVSGHYMILPMKSKNVDEFSEKSKMLTAADRENIKSLKIGEFYYMSGDEETKLIGVNRATPFEMWQTPSNAEDSFKAAKALKKHKGDALKAINELAQLSNEQLEGVVNE